ncbi:MAG: alpha/beta fold hydrolase [Proteobacteria bacterium]|nr:alpha/beta fold hydrolase [Pseudomonadota bacterium]
MAEQILRETLEAADGLQLYCEVFPSPSPKAIVVLCHDYGEHVGVYHSLCSKLSQEGYKVYAQDLRGHGKSPGERGYIKNFDDFLEDLDLLLARIQDRESDAKIFLLGQGLGALIATHYTFSRKPRLCGLIFCGLIIDLPLSPWQKTLIRYGGPLLARSTFAPELQALLLRPELDGFLKGDPLVFKGPLQLQSIKEIGPWQNIGYRSLG